MTEEMLMNGLINWYPWKKGASVYFAGDCQEEFKQDILSRGVVEKTTPPFDYIIAVRILEESKNPTGLLQSLKACLNADGHLFLACENRLGIQYFAGDQDPYTHRVMDGIENYPNGIKKGQNKTEGRCYARYEIEDFLKKAGISSYRGYSVLPGLLMPQQMYSWTYLPKEELQARYTPLYHHPGSVFMDAAKVYDSIIGNGMFHQMANAYLIDCSNTDDFFKALHVTTSMDRGRKNAMATIICEDDLVYKFALYPEGNLRIDKLLENTEELKSKNISVLPMQRKDMGKYKDKELLGCVMPYVQAPTGLQYLRTLLYQDKEKFVQKTTEFLEIILASSSEVPGTEQEELSPVYQKVYTDLVPLNSFFVEDTFVIFDQEFCEIKYPIGVVLMRTLDIIYAGDKRMEERVPMSYFTTRYGLNQKRVVYSMMGEAYLRDLRNRECLMEFNGQHLADVITTNNNRQKINYSVAEYQKLFVDLLRDIKGKKLFLFGSGIWARKFIAQYKETITIEALLDNNAEKQGQMIEGYKVESPKVLEALNTEEYKVIICIKQYDDVMQQLSDIGVKHYGIFDPNAEIPVVAEEKKERIRDAEAEKDFSDTEKKRYHIGYVAGVFDLFHIGHLNLLKRAKEQCDILLVGVVSDEQAMGGKVHAPYIKQEERMEIVQACKYVDKAFVLPPIASGSRDVYRKYRFDVQFSGSDYAHDVSWLKEQAWLREHGSDLVFFPYTESTSSTKIKEELKNSNDTRRQQFDSTGLF